MLRIWNLLQKRDIVYIVFPGYFGQDVLIDVEALDLERRDR